MSKAEDLRLVRKDSCLFGLAGGKVCVEGENTDEVRLKAGGVALNLTAASHVFQLELTLTGMRTRVLAV
jgi:hypothetical protein